MEKLEKTREGILTQISSLGDLRRGSLAVRYVPCGKNGCHCTKPGSKGHGPKYSLTWKIKGKTKTKYFPYVQAELVQTQIENRKQFSLLCQELLEVNEKICDLRLEEKVTEKTGPKKNSPKLSRKKYRGKLNVS